MRGLWRRTAAFTRDSRCHGATSFLTWGGGRGVKLTWATDYISGRRDKSPPFLGGGCGVVPVAACARVKGCATERMDGWMSGRMWGILRFTADVGNARAKKNKKKLRCKQTNAGLRGGSCAVSWQQAYVHVRVRERERRREQRGEAKASSDRRLSPPFITSLFFSFLFFFTLSNHGDVQAVG